MRIRINFLSPRLKNWQQINSLPPPGGFFLIELPKIPEHPKENLALWAYLLKAETTYAVRWCDTILVKDIQKIADGIKLISRNPAYEPIVLTGNAVNEIQIIGSVLGGFYTK